MRKLALLALATFLAGCVPAESDTSAVGQPSTMVFVDHGNGLLYFNHTGGDFGNALSTYLSQHPAQQVTAIAGDGQGVYGKDRGYFVTFLERDVS